MQEKKVEEVVTENRVLTVGFAMLVAGLIVGFLIGWYWNKNAYLAPVEDSLNNVEATTTEVISAVTTAPTPTSLYKTVEIDAKVSVLDQKAGNLVFVQHVEVKEPTWVAIREINGTTAGNILGAEMVTSPTDDLPVTLLRSTKRGEKYAVYLYKEDGDGEFDFKKDALIVDEEVPVSALFLGQ